MDRVTWFATWIFALFQVITYFAVRANNIQVNPQKLSAINSDANSEIIAILNDNFITIGQIYDIDFNPLYSFWDIARSTSANIQNSNTHLRSVLRATNLRDGQRTELSEYINKIDDLSYQLQKIAQRSVQYYSDDINTINRRIKMCIQLIKQHLNEQNFTGILSYLHDTKHTTFFATETKQKMNKLILEWEHYKQLMKQYYMKMADVIDIDQFKTGTDSIALVPSVINLTNPYDRLYDFLLNNAVYLEEGKRMDYAQRCKETKEMFDGDAMRLEKCMTGVEIILNDTAEIEERLIGLNQQIIETAIDTENLKEYLRNNNEYEIMLQESLDMALDKCEISKARHDGYIVVEIKYDMDDDIETDYAMLTT